jgi:hypothetical protein
LPKQEEKEEEKKEDSDVQLKVDQKSVNANEVDTNGGGQKNEPQILLVSEKVTKIEAKAETAEVERIIFSDNSNLEQYVIGK